MTKASTFNGLLIIIGGNKTQ